MFKLAFKPFLAAFLCLLLAAAPSHAQLLLLGVGGGSSSGGGNPSLAISGPSSGQEGVPSTNFTITLTGSTFNGSRTVTIADGSQGGTFTPSVGSPGTSTVTVTPASGTSFTFTYTPAVLGAITLTVTNAQGWANPSPVTYTSNASGTTTFDPSNLSTFNTLSNANLTCNGAGGGGSAVYGLCRSITSHATGKYYFEMTLTTNNAGNTAVGVVTSAAGVNSVSPGFDSNLSLAIYVGSNGAFLNGSSITSLNATPAVGDIIAVAIDTGNALIWVQDIVGGTTTGNWNNSGTANPATGVGGASISAMSGALFANTGFNVEDASGVTTANFGASTYAITAHGSGVPAGFGNY